MARTVALARRIEALDAARSVIVVTSALALIASGRFFPLF